MSWRFGRLLGLAYAHEGWQQPMQQSNFLGRDPNFTHNHIASLFHEVERMEDQGFPFQDNPVGIEERDFELPRLDEALQVLLVFFLGHDLQLLCVRDIVLNFLDLHENFVLVGGQLILFHPEVVTDLVNFAQHHRPTLENTDERGSGMPFTPRLIGGDIESVQNAVALRHPEDHFGKSLDLLGLDDTGDVDEPELLQRMFVEVDFGGTILTMENFPGPEQQIFIIL